MNDRTEKRLRALGRTNDPEGAMALARLIGQYKLRHSFDLDVYASSGKRKFPAAKKRSRVGAQRPVGRKDDEDGYASLSKKRIRIRRIHNALVNRWRAFPDDAKNVDLAPVQFLERTRDERRAFRVGHQAFARPFWRLQISDGRRNGPSAEFKCGAHPGARAVRAHVVVELREGRQYPFHQLAGGRVVDRIGRRSQ